jgi:hypothetical protein
MYILGELNTSECLINLYLYMYIYIYIQKGIQAMYICVK